MNRLRKFLGLPRGERRLLAASLLVVATVRTGLWIFPFRWVSKWTDVLESSRGGTKSAAADWRVVGEVVRAVKTGSRFVPSATCLTQALATRILLGLNGQSSRMRIGVDKDAGNRLTAHAWLEVERRIVIGEERGHSRFVVLEPSNQVFL